VTVRFQIITYGLHTCDGDHFLLVVSLTHVTLNICRSTY